METLTMKMRQFGNTLSTARLCVQRLYVGLVKLKIRQRTLKDVMRANRLKMEYKRMTRRK